MWQAMKWGAVTGIVMVALAVCTLMMGCGKKPQSQPKPHTQAEPLANTTATYTCTGCTSAAGATVGNTFHLELSKTRHRGRKINTSIHGAGGAQLEMAATNWSGVALERGPSIMLYQGIGDSRGLVVRIEDAHMQLMAEVAEDGTVTYGEDYHPDDASRAFWKALASAANQYPNSICVGPMSKNPRHEDVQP